MRVRRMRTHNKLACTCVPVGVDPPLSEISISQLLHRAIEAEDIAIAIA